MKDGRRRRGGYRGGPGFGVGVPLVCFVFELWPVLAGLQTLMNATCDKLCIPLQLQDLRRVLLDHEQLLLSEHLLLGEELELGCVLQ